MTLGLKNWRMTSRRSASLNTGMLCTYPSIPTVKERSTSSLIKFREARRRFRDSTEDFLVEGESRRVQLLTQCTRVCSEDRTLARRFRQPLLARDLHCMWW